MSAEAAEKLKKRMATQRARDDEKRLARKEYKKKLTAIRKKYRRML